MHFLLSEGETHSQESEWKMRQMVSSYDAAMDKGYGDTDKTLSLP